MTMKSLALAAALIVMPAAGALAHAHLVTSVPPVGSEVPPVSVVTLNFSEGIETSLSSFMIMSADGKMVNGTVSTDASKKIVTVQTGKLAAGTYMVHWHVVSVDTHKTEGTFEFTIKP